MSNGTCGTFDPLEAALEELVELQERIQELEQEREILLEDRRHQLQAEREANERTKFVDGKVDELKEVVEKLNYRIGNVSLINWPIKSDARAYSADTFIGMSLSRDDLIWNKAVEECKKIVNATLGVDDMPF